MSNALPKLAIPESIVNAKRPIISELHTINIANSPHQCFHITAPEEVINLLWDQLYATGGVVNLKKETRFMVEITVNPLTDGEKFRLAVMAYIFEIYVLSDEIAEYQAEQANEALAAFFNLPAELATAVAQMLAAGVARYQEDEEVEKITE